MKKILFPLLFLWTLSSVYAQQEQKDFEDAITLIEVWLDAQKDYKNIPGIMGMIVKDQELIWANGFGQSNIEKGIKADTSSICSICSITKTFTAVGVMKLISEGKLQLDDEVKDILPFYAVEQKFPQGGAVTIRSLLAHNSGLPRDTGPYWTAPDFKFPKKKAFRSQLQELETESPVGTNWSYSNIGYALLGEVIEHVSGMPYEKYIQTHVLDLLGMTNTGFGKHKSLSANKYAMGYTALDRDGKRERAGFFDTRAMSPVAGLSATVLDLAKYASWQFRLHEGKATELLSPSMLKQAHEVQSQNKSGDRSWGLGFEVYTDSKGHRWATHGGICPGFVSFLRMDLTDKMAYAVLINANSVSAGRYSKGIIDILAKAPTKSEQSTVDVNLSDYTGYYNLKPWNSEYYVAKWGDQLVLLYLPADNPAYSMYFYQHREGDTFQLIDQDGTLTEETLIFERDRKGQVYRVKNEGNYHIRTQ